ASFAWVDADVLDHPRGLGSLALFELLDRSHVFKGCDPVAKVLGPKFLGWHRDLLEETTEAGHDRGLWQYRPEYPRCNARSL
ncbi:MAG: hypothetical protein QOG16_241, partial [Actinomycetota bacterium]|nr:hypothetical protein [Actinomycetota bacterium]